MRVFVSWGRAVALAAALTAGGTALAEKALYAGAFTATINPPLGSYIGGDALNRTFTAFHDDLFAKALAVSDGVETVVIATTDTLGIGLPTVEAIRNLVIERIGPDAVKPEHIVIASTHIHNGPDVVGIYGPDRETSGVNPVYMRRMINETANAIVKAIYAMDVATARYAEASHGEGWVRNESVPEEIDRSVTTLQFLHEETGECIATLTNFACHPTILDGVHDAVSADFVGGYYRGMEASSAGAHLFVQGAIGGWVQPNKGDRSFALADSYGKGLASTVIAALADAKALPGDDRVEIRTRRTTFPLENAGWEALAAAGVIDRALGAGVETELAWLRIGDAQFATHPGETSPLYSEETKALMGTGPKFVIGLGSDALGYILKPAFYGDSDLSGAEYLTRMSCGPETGPKMMEALAALIP